jgi:LysM repeat protein
MFAQLFAIALLAVSAQSVVAASSCIRSYTVQAGDFCDSISQAQNVSTYQLAALNAGNINSGCSNLVPGTTLCLGQNAAEDCRTTYVVVPGDTCSVVASKNSINMTILNMNNPQIDSACDNIYTGEVLCTAQTVMVPPVPAGGVVLPAPAASSTTLAPAATSATPAVAPPAITSAAAPAITSAPAAASDNSGDSSDNDDDLPFCDEL